MQSPIENTCTAQQKQDGTSVTLPTVLPRIDILELKDEVQVLVDLPGVEPSGVNLEVHQGELQVVANPSNPVRDGSKSLLLERRSVQFKRHLKLSDSLDQEKIWAEQAKGVLKIHLPKKEEIQSRKIEVRQG